MDKPHVFLREAKKQDALFLFNLRNDVLVRQQSFNVRPVSWEEHLLWLEKTLVSEKEHIYILTDGSEDYGQVRLSVSGEETELSYSIKRGARGRGLGKQILTLAESVFIEKEQTILIGKVKSGNAVSKHIFEVSGYTGEEKEAEESMEKYILFKKQIRCRKADHNDENKSQHRTVGYCQ